MSGPTLLIGGMGFIGLHTARSFLDSGQDVVVTFHANRREPDFLAKDIGTRARVEQRSSSPAATTTPSLPSWTTTCSEYWGTR